MMKCVAYGDEALLVTFGQEINPEINDRVISLSRKIEDTRLAGVTYQIAAYCSLTVGFDPTQISFEQLADDILHLSKVVSRGESVHGMAYRIPVCYADEFALDMETVSEHSGLSADEIIRMHTAMDFRIYMIGFLPGFAYMGRLPDELHCPRRATPRVQVPAHSVGLAGLQTGIYPSESPGGWQIIGRTPVQIFRPHQDIPFLFNAGDSVRFESISRVAFDDIYERSRLGDFDMSSLRAG